MQLWDCAGVCSRPLFLFQQPHAPQVIVPAAAEDVGINSHRRREDIAAQLAHTQIPESTRWRAARNLNDRHVAVSGAAHHPRALLLRPAWHKAGNDCSGIAWPAAHAATPELLASSAVHAVQVAVLGAKEDSSSSFRVKQEGGRGDR
jgi:hypothetical protein